MNKKGLLIPPLKPYRKQNPFNLFQFYMVEFIQ